MSWNAGGARRATEPTGSIGVEGGGVVLDARARPRPGIEPGRRLADRDVLYLCVALATARREVGLSRVRSKETQRRAR